MSPPLPKEPVPKSKVHKKSTTQKSKGAKQVDNTRGIDRNATVDTKNIDNRDKVEDNVDQGQDQTQNKDNDKSEIEDDDGWEHYFDEKTQRFFFYNTKSKIKQWLNPRVSPNDECNQNLPSFDPPKLPFEEETSYDKKLKELREDSEFQKLSTFEKYKRVEALKTQLESDEQDSQDNEVNITSTDLQNELKDVKPFDDDVNFNDYGSKSIHAQDLNQSIKSLNNNNGKTNNNKHKISKQQIRQFNDKKKQKRQDKLKKWLRND